MKPLLEELDYRRTPLGDLVLRRRQAAMVEGVDVYEVTLDGEFLMSSLVNDSEIALANLALPLLGSRECDVLVGGLGLGYTAAAALRFSNVRSLTVVEYLPAVLEWHKEHLVPLGKVLTGDERCELVGGDFFAMLRAGELPRERYDAMLIDIDHSPEYLLDPANAWFYETEGLKHAAAMLSEGGVLAIWSADRPEEPFVERLREVFATVETHMVEFFNPLFGEPDANTIYIAQCE